MGVGSQQVVVEKTPGCRNVAVRSRARYTLFANLGAVQLNYDYGLDECLRVVDSRRLMP